MSGYGFTRAVGWTFIQSQCVNRTVEDGVLTVSSMVLKKFNTTFDELSFLMAYIPYTSKDSMSPLFIPALVEPLPLSDVPISGDSVDADSMDKNGLILNDLVSEPFCNVNYFYFQLPSTLNAIQRGKSEL
ncbi:unnamed protein product [Orchesella dallaii]|uniref:Uncharacterized protein n=1 Tax=Orchesella dallaii TaxID=48710 RepID=A0ABP1PSL7_9HEXA